jgi:pseudouridine-5'-phosphate glycosidase
MEKELPPKFQLSEDILHALSVGSPVVALESTVITHGLPHPENLALAGDMEREVRENGAVPATIALLDGSVHIGLQPSQLARLAGDKDVHKISVRDFATAIAMGWSGGTTVAGTMLAASLAGIRVFATGGIGGVHRQPPNDISADLPQLSKTPMIVVCAGAKAILDLPATIEYLETQAVPVIGYRTDEFPAFYSLSSGLPVSARADSPNDVVSIARTHWGLGLRSAVLVVQPPPEDLAIPNEKIEGFIQQALDEAQARQVRGQAVTPFLLGRVSELTGGASLKVNLALLRNNARLAARITLELSRLAESADDSGHF